MISEDYYVKAFSTIESHINRQEKEIGGNIDFDAYSENLLAEAVIFLKVFYPNLNGKPEHAVIVKDIKDVFLETACLGLFIRFATTAIYTCLLKIDRLEENKLTARDREYYRDIAEGYLMRGMKHLLPPDDKDD